MISQDMAVIAIAAALVREKIPAGKTLEERLQFAMSYVRKNERDLFFLVDFPSDDLKFRTALAAVMQAGSEEDREVIERSMLLVRMLSAAMQGIPVDFSAMATMEGTIPLLGLWHESGQA